MRNRLYLRRDRSGSSTPVANTAIGQDQSTSTDKMADSGMDRRRWPKGLSASAVGTVFRHLVARPGRLWDRATGVQRTPLQIGSGLDVEVADMRGYAEAAAVAMMRSGGLSPGRRGEDYADGVDAGQIVRTRPRNGAFVPMGSTVDYVVASSVDRPPGALAGGSSFVDHDATARLKHEAP